MNNFYAQLIDQLFEIAGVELNYEIVDINKQMSPEEEATRCLKLAETLNPHMRTKVLNYWQLLSNSVTDLLGTTYTEVSKATDEGIFESTEDGLLPVSNLVDGIDGVLHKIMTIMSEDKKEWEDLTDHEKEALEASITGCLLNTHSLMRQLDCYGQFEKCRKAFKKANASKETMKAFAKVRNSIARFYTICEGIEICDTLGLADKVVFELPDNDE